MTGVWGTARQVPGTNGGPMHVDAVRAVACAPGGECVAAGYNSGIDGFVTAYRNGTWGKAIAIPGLASLSAGETIASSEIYALTCPAAGDCVVTGEYDGASQVPGTFVAHQTSGTWKKAMPLPRQPALKTSGFGGPGTIACASPGNCVVGGSYSSGQAQQEPFLASEVGGTWGKAMPAPGYTSVTAAGDNGVIDAVSCASPGNCVAMGDMSPASYGTTDAFLIAERNGAWATPSVLRGVELLALACPVPGQCLAGGVDSKHVAAIATEAGGQWNGQAEIPGAARLAYKGKEAIASGVTALACPAAGQCVAGGQYNWGEVAPSGPSGQDASQVFLSAETAGSWGAAQVPAGLAALNTQAYADLAGLSCATAGKCAAGGYYSYGGSAQASTGAFTTAEAPAGS